jgi:hypothetical protein
MGIISSFGAVMFLVVLAMLWIRVRDLADESDLYVWIARGILVVGAFVLLWVINAYIVPVRSPFDGPKIEHLPPRAPPVEAPEDLKLDAPRTSPDLNDVAQEHRRQLEKFEQKTSH